MWETIRGYLTFTRKERIGVLFLLLIMSILFVLPYFIKPAPGDPDPDAYQKIKEGINKFESRQTDSDNETNTNFVLKDSAAKINRYFSFPKSANRIPFYFDPNKLEMADWQSLGLSEKMSHTILHYRARGGIFRTAGDLKKLYGLTEADYNLIYPHVRIPEKPLLFRNHNSYPVKKEIKEFPLHKTYQAIDINEADSLTWCLLPGIGAGFAARIIHFREKLGGFYQTDQVSETFGLPDSVFQKIKSSLRISIIKIEKINLNGATQEQLQAHPYIRWRLAKAIINYRSQHGSFNSIDDILQIVQIDSTSFVKMKPYLTVTKNMP